MQRFFTALPHCMMQRFSLHCRIANKRARHQFRRLPKMMGTNTRHQRLTG
jgi:hypothetical protein